MHSCKPFTRDAGYSPGNPTVLTQQRLVLLACNVTHHGRLLEFVDLACLVHLPAVVSDIVQKDVGSRKAWINDRARHVTLFRTRALTHLFVPPDLALLG